jgi:hypothetical protein
VIYRVVKKVDRRVYVLKQVNLGNMKEKMRRNVPRQLDSVHQRSPNTVQVEEPFHCQIPRFIPRPEPTKHHYGVLRRRRPRPAPKTANWSPTKVRQDLEDLPADPDRSGVHPQQAHPAPRHKNPEHLPHEGLNRQDRRPGRRETAERPRRLRPDNGWHPILPVPRAMLVETLQRQERYVGTGLPAVRDVHIQAPFRGCQPRLVNFEDREGQVHADF